MAAPVPIPDLNLTDQSSVDSGSGAFTVSFNDFGGSSRTPWTVYAVIGLAALAVILGMRK